MLFVQLIVLKKNKKRQMIELYIGCITECGIDGATNVTSVRNILREGNSSNSDSSLIPQEKGASCSTLSERTTNLTCPVTNCSKTNLLTKSGDRDDRCKYYTKTTVTKDTVELCATETYQKYESNNKYQGFSYNETSKECNLFDKCYKNGRVNSQSISSLKQDSDNSNIKHYRLKEAIEDEPYINSFKSVTSDNCNYEGVKIYSEGIIQSIDSCSEKCYNNEVTNGQNVMDFFLMIPMMYVDYLQSVTIVQKEDIQKFQQIHQIHFIERMVLILKNLL